MVNNNLFLNSDDMKQFKRGKRTSRNVKEIEQKNNN